MTINLLTLLLTGLLGISSQALATQENTEEQITQRLEARSKVQGHFVQTRTLEGMSNSLRSEGEFLFWRDHGIYWAIAHPIEQAVTYRSDKTLKWVTGEVQPEVLRGRKDKQFRKILMAIFSFDEEQLALQFDQQWQIDGINWQLRFSPNSLTVSRFLKQIVLWGADDIQGLRIANSNGEALTMEFSDEHQLEAIDTNTCISHFGYTPDQCEQFLSHGTP